MMLSWHAALCCGLICCLFMTASHAQPRIAPDDAPYLNTWLIAGPFANDATNTGFERDWIGEMTVRPVEQQTAGEHHWTYFDDRLFSRNYDDYQDLFSYLRVYREQKAAGAVVYAHLYVHADQRREAQLRVGADNEFRAWLNGAPVVTSLKSGPYRDTVKTDIVLEAGWNRLLLKIANQEEGRLGFYARLGDAQGHRLPGVTLSVHGGTATDGNPRPLAVSTRDMVEARTDSLPTAYRDWPYIGADPLKDPDPDLEGQIRRKPHLTLHASDFALLAEGGSPPYRWTLEKGRLPEGLRLESDGRLTGTTAPATRLSAYPVTVRVTDSAGSSARRDLSMTVRERPNRWYEEARLVALMHNPESLTQTTDPEAEFREYARRMKRQGYALGMMISYNNGDFLYRFPNRYEPDPKSGDLAARYKAALEAEGIRFGMYMGNLIGPNHGGDNGAILMVEEAVRRYRPAALWFDWASDNPDGYVSLDALYSMIRTLSPETVIVLNGVGTLYQGDWDVICVEGWGAWGRRMWATWPFPLRWVKRVPVETWRMLPDPGFEYSTGDTPDWQEQLRVQLSIIGQGFVANIDNSPTIHSPYRSLDESVVMQAHRRMMEWANPPDAPSLAESYTQVNPGPLLEGAWGYDTINRARDTIYLHMLKNPFGKTGLPAAGTLTVGPIRRKVTAVRIPKQSSLRQRQARRSHRATWPRASRPG